MSRWKSIRYQIEALACRALAAAIPMLSRRACVRSGNALGAIAYAVDRRGRAVADANLYTAFGDRYSAADRKRIARASYQTFARTMLDLFWVPRMTRDNYRRWIHLEGYEELEELLAREKKGFVFVTTHFGNWEWANIIAGFKSLNQVTVAENFKNPRLTEIFKALREHSGATLIPQENSLLRMLKVVKRGGMTSLLIDLNLRPSQAATIIEAFRTPEAPGFSMCVPLLHTVLAQRAGALLVPAETRPQPDGSCRVIVHPPIATDGASLQEIAQRCWDVFEPIICATPELYLWPYKHFRYRPKDAPREYPFYANQSGRFEKLRRELAKSGSAAKSGASDQV